MAATLGTVPPADSSLDSTSKCTEQHAEASRHLDSARVSRCQGIAIATCCHQRWAQSLCMQCCRALGDAFGTSSCDHSVLAGIAPLMWVPDSSKHKAMLIPCAHTQDMSAPANLELFAMHDVNARGDEHIGTSCSFALHVQLRYNRTACPAVIAWHQACLCKMLTVKYAGVHGSHTSTSLGCFTIALAQNSLQCCVG